MAENTGVGSQNMAKANKNLYNDKDKAIRVCFKAVKWLSHESMPLNQYTSLMKMLRDLDTPHMELLYVDWL